MNIVMISENDPAGMGIAFTNAINRYSDHSCRLITSQDRYGIDFGKDIHLPDILDDDYSEVEDLLKSADIFHFHMLSDENSYLGPLVIKDFTKGKKIIHHHHGHPDFRAHPKKYQQKYKRLGRRTLVSTPDLLKLLPEALWQPNIVPTGEKAYCPTSISSEKRKTVVIGQSPTRTELKNTIELRQCVAALQANGLSGKISLHIMERMPHMDCLAAKRKCDIIFDHMQGYYGISSLESLSQGKPVIAGLDEWNIRCIQEFTGANTLPWQVARDGDQLKHVLQSLINNPSKRQEIGKQSRTFMKQRWTEQQALSVLLKFYEEQ